MPPRSHGHIVPFALTATPVQENGESQAAPSLHAESDGPGDTIIPTLTIQATNPSAFEFTEDPAEFTVYLDDPPDEDLTVYYSVGGTASGGSDYEALSGEVVVLAGARTATIAVEVNDDASVEGDETIVVTLDADPDDAYDVGTADTATVTLYDDDESIGNQCPCSGGGTPYVWISTNDKWAIELGQDTATFLIGISPPQDDDLVVNFTVSGSASSDDYRPIGVSATIPGGWHQAKVTIVPVDDDDVEEIETLTLTLDPSSYYALSGGQDAATVVIYDEGDSGGSDETQTVDLRIYNGQNAADPVELEETVGAFTVANLNDSDSDGTVIVAGQEVYTPDRDDVNGVNRVIDGVSQGDPDLMRLDLLKPVPDNGGSVTLRVSSQYVKLWEERTKQTPIVLTDLEVSIATTQLDKTIWVELTASSNSVRDYNIEMHYGGKRDLVRMTAIWATFSGFRNSQTTTTLTGNYDDVTSTQITVANPTGFNVGDHIVLFHGATGSSRKRFDIAAINGSVFTLSDAIGAYNWTAGDQVRQGLSRDVTDEQVLGNFVNFGGKLGAEHVSPLTVNGMEMQFTVGPPGIGDEKGIIFDITRQKETVWWDLINGVWTELIQAGISPSSFPSHDEMANDDDGSEGDHDEDDTPKNNHIYSFDTPGFPSDQALWERSVFRANFREFVRVKFDGQPFANESDQIEGSRASARVPWRARMDVVENVLYEKWQRNNNQPQGEIENEVEVGHKELTRNKPWP